MKSVLTILVAAIIAGILFITYKIQSNGGGLSGVLATVLGESKESQENLEPIQILIMGISGVDDYKLADSIMVASYNPKNQSASLMSIPRDTYVGRKDRKNATHHHIPYQLAHQMLHHLSHQPILLMLLYLLLHNFLIPIPSTC